MATQTALSITPPDTSEKDAGIAIPGTTATSNIEQPGTTATTTSNITPPDTTAKEANITLPGGEEDDAGNQPVAAPIAESTATQEVPEAPVFDIPTPQESTYVPAALTETGVGTTYSGETYSGQSEADTLAASQAGLISMLEQDNPLMQLARLQGAREAESRGLGGSSLRERASQGAAIESAMPLVQQAGQLASAERQTAQQATAQSSIAAMQATAQSEMAAADRRLTELTQQYALAVQAGDNAAARQLQSEISNEQNILAQWQTQASLASNEQMQADQLLVQQEMQNVDVEYKEWLEQTTYDHQAILQGNQQAATAYSEFNSAAANILNNPDTSTSQKKAAIQALQDGLTNSLNAISATANIDLSQFLPPSTGTDTSAGGSWDITVPVAETFADINWDTIEPEDIPNAVNIGGGVTKRYEY